MPTINICSHPLGETVFRDIRCQSLFVHPAMYYALDRVDETGLSSPHRSVEKDPELPTSNLRFVVLHVVQSSLIVSAQRKRFYSCARCSTCYRWKVN